MQFNLEKLDQNFVAIEITVDSTEVEAALAEAYKKVVHKVNLPGFRKGQIPRPILEAQFGKEVLYEEAMDILVPKAYFAALEQHQIDAIAQPKLEVKEAFGGEKPFRFIATVEVLPEVKLGKYKGLDVKKAKVKIGEEQIAERLKALQERHSELVLSDKEQVAKGDHAVIDFEGYIDGKPFPGGAAQGHTLEIGSGSFIPGFEEQLEGMMVGTEKEITVPFPQDYPKPELAGKDSTFKVALKEIKVKEVPALDDEFAKTVGKYQDLAELKAEIKEKMVVMAEQEMESNYTQELIDKAVESSKVELPDTLVKNEMEELLHSFEHNLSYQGLAFDQYLAYSKKTKEEVMEDFRPEAVKRVKTDLVLDAIAKAEALEASEEELDLKLKELALRYQQKDPAKMRKDLEKNGRLGDIKHAIILEKAADLIKASALTKDKDKDKDWRSTRTLKSRPRRSNNDELSTNGSGTEQPRRTGI